VTVKLFNFRKDFYSSCNTDWCNYAEKTALFTGINYILKYIKIGNGYLKV